MCGVMPGCLARWLWLEAQRNFIERKRADALLRAIKSQVSTRTKYHMARMGENGGKKNS
jgi:hypothetical protein